MVDIDTLRKIYPAGTRIKLISMNDAQAPACGTKGTVIGVDDIGSILVNWDNGSSLNVVYGEDQIEIIKTIKTTCYGKVKEWDSAVDAIVFFGECYICSEGSERERYKKILNELKKGLKNCSD